MEDVTITDKQDTAAMREIGRALWRLRSKKDMSRQVLAMLSGLHRNTIFKAETRTECIQVETLWEICRVLGTTFSQVVKDAEDCTRSCAGKKEKDGKIGELQLHNPLAPTEHYGPAPR